MTVLGGFNVTLTEAAAVLVAPGVMGVERTGDATGEAFGPPDGYDGAGWYLIIPEGVTAVTIQMFGAPGGFADGVPVDDPMYPVAGPGLSGDPDTPIVHTRRLAVTAGQVLAFFVGGPPLDAAQNFATRGNGPLWGSTGARSDAELYLAGAGGGASAVYLDGVLVGLSPGGAGAWWYAVDSTWNPPPTIYPTGAAGDESIDPGWAGGFGGPYGGGGGGAPYGPRGESDTTPGQNGSVVDVDTDSGGPASPTWEQTPIGDPANRDGAASAVRIYFYAPNGWTVGRVSL